MNPSISPSACTPLPCLCLWPQGEIEDLRRVLDALEADLKAQFKADTAVEMHALVQVRPYISHSLKPYLSPYLSPSKPLSKPLWP